MLPMLTTLKRTASNALPITALEGLLSSSSLLHTKNVPFSLRPRSLPLEARFSASASASSPSFMHTSHVRALSQTRLHSSMSLPLKKQALSQSAPAPRAKRFSTEEDVFLIDLRENPRLVSHVLENVYNDLLLPNILDPDEVAPLEVLRRKLDPEDSLYYDTAFHVVLAFDANDVEAVRNRSASFLECKPIGALIFEYFPRSRCGLVNYLLVDERARGTGITTLLNKQAFPMLDLDAMRLHDQARLLPAEQRTAPAPDYCPMIFGEANNPSLVADDEDTVPPSLRIKMAHTVGWRHVQIDYVQPPLGEGKRASPNLLLVSLDRSRVFPALDCAERTPSSPQAQFFVEAFLDEYWQRCLELNPNYLASSSSSNNNNSSSSNSSNNSNKHASVTTTTTTTTTAAASQRQSSVSANNFAEDEEMFAQMMAKIKAKGEVNIGDLIDFKYVKKLSKAELQKQLAN